MKILTGDIGGTNTRLALLEHGSNGLKTLRQLNFSSRDHDSLNSLLSEFVSALDGPPQAAGFALAGPITGRSCQLTNLPWRIDADELEDRLSIPRVILLNDLEATAWGIDLLGEQDLANLQKGVTDACGNRTVIAAGTGLGQAGLFWNGVDHLPFPSEGGHCDFAARNELEFELLRHLQRQYGHVSWERVVSGPGLVAIHRFLRDYRGSRASATLTEKMSSGDRAAAIVEAADLEADPVCVETMELFVRLYGAEAGNQALKHMATGGVFIGGGIAPKILRWLQMPLFMQAFRDKGQMRHLMERMTVQVILNDRIALYGPAARLLSERAAAV